MPFIPLYAPQLGEGISSLKIVTIFKKEGEQVAIDEPLVAVETDKAIMEIESPSTGIVKNICCMVGNKVKVGDILLHIDDEAYVMEKDTDILEKSFPVLVKDNDTALAGLSPRIIGYCRRNNIDISKLNTISGTGEQNRLRLQDVVSYVKHLPSARYAPYIATLSPSWLEEEMKYDMAKQAYQVHKIAKSQLHLNYAMQQSSNIPQASVTLSARLPKKPLSYVTYALAEVSKKFEKLRSEYIDNTTLHIHDECVIGCAIALPNDVLATIIIEASVFQDHAHIAQFLQEQVAHYRRQKTELPAVKRHSVAISDMSGFGIEQANPFVVAPAIATLFIGAANREGISYMTLAFDHRVMNGSYASRVLRSIAQKVDSL